MKNNRKNRKLTYIRKKNGMIKHGIFSFMKISNEIIEDDLLFKSVLESTINNPDRHIVKMFAGKYKLVHINTEIKMISDDFIRDLCTLKNTFKVSIIPLSLY